MAAAAGTDVAQPASAGQTRRKGFYQGGQEGQPLYPAIRYV